MSILTNHYELWFDGFVSDEEKGEILGEIRSIIKKAPIPERDPGGVAKVYGIGRVFRPGTKGAPSDTEQHVKNHVIYQGRRFSVRRRAFLDVLFSPELASLDPRRACYVAGINSLQYQRMIHEPGLGEEIARRTLSEIVVPNLPRILRSIVDTAAKGGKQANESRRLILHMLQRLPEAVSPIGAASSNLSTPELRDAAKREARHLLHLVQESEKRAPRNLRDVNPSSTPSTPALESDEKRVRMYPAMPEGSDDVGDDDEPQDQEE